MFCGLEVYCWDLQAVAAFWLRDGFGVVSDFRIARRPAVFELRII